MIVMLPMMGDNSAPRTGILLLDHLYDYWDEARADAVMPLADELFLREFSDSTAILTLAYRREGGFRIEFAGETARELAGPLTGLDAGNEAVIGEMQRGFESVQTLRAPGVTRHARFIALHLPYGDAVGKVSVVLSVLAPHVRRAATVLAFPTGGGP